MAKGSGTVFRFSPAWGGIILAVIVFGAVSLHALFSTEQTVPALPARPQRLISLSPSITQSVYALGLGGLLAGVTQYCIIPEGVEAPPRVGSLSNVNYEAVVRLQPDLVLLPIEMENQRPALEKLDLPTVSVNTRTIPALLESLHRIGTATGYEAKADALIANITATMQAAQAASAGRPRPRVLFSVLRQEQEQGMFTEATVVGKDGFYNDIITAAGGENAYQGRMTFPRLSREAILALDPDVIVDPLVPGEDRDRVLASWRTLSGVSAIRNNRLLLLTQRSSTIPGADFYKTLALLSRTFHPEGTPPAMTEVPE